MPRPLRKPSPSLVISLVSLSVALGGTSYAAVTITSANIKNNTVASADIKDNSIQGKDVRNSTLTSSDVKDGSLTSKDIKGGLPAGVPGAPGARGPAGPQGPKGDAGNTNVFPFSFRLGNGESRVIGSAGGLTFTARCVINGTIGGASRDRALIDLATSADDAAFEDQYSGAGDDDFDIADGPSNLAFLNTTPGLVKYLAPSSGPTATAASGQTISLGNYALGVNVGGATGKCTFGGAVLATNGT